MSPVLKHPEQLGITLRAIQVLPPSYETRRGPLLDPIGVSMKGDVTIVRGFVGSTARKGSVLLNCSSLMLAGMASTTMIWATEELANTHASTANPVKYGSLRRRDFMFSSKYY